MSNAGDPRKWYQLTLVERLVVIAIATAVVAIVIAPAKWASSGDIDVPVEVLVFDVRTAKPIPHATLDITRGLPWISDEFQSDFKERFDGIEKTIRDRNLDHSSWRQGSTGDDGIASLVFKFRTGANHERPEPSAHTNYAWIFVTAEGYGGAAVPVRHESMPTKKTRELKKLRVPIGLFPRDEK